MVIRRIVFANDNLIERNYAVGFAEFNINTVLFDALNDCRQNFVFFVGIFLKDCALFRFAMRCITTCFAVCAAILPKFFVSASSSRTSPIS